MVAEAVAAVTEEAAAGISEEVEEGILEEEEDSIPPQWVTLALRIVSMVAAILECMVTRASTVPDHSAVITHITAGTS